MGARVFFPDGHMPAPPEPETAIETIARALYYVTPVYRRMSDLYVRVEWDAADEVTRARMTALATVAVDARLATLAGTYRVRA